MVTGCIANDRLQGALNALQASLALLWVGAYGLRSLRVL